MTWSLVASGHFNEDDFRQNEVLLDEKVRDFVEELQRTFGDAAIGQVTLSGNYIGNGTLFSSTGDVTPRPTLPDSDPSVGTDFIDESVVDDSDGDSGLGDDTLLPDDPGAVDASGDHPGDVLNPKYEDDLAQNRSVPGVELRPNPEDQTGFKDTTTGDDKVAAEEEESAAEEEDNS